MGVHTLRAGAYVLLPPTAKFLAIPIIGTSVALREANDTGKTDPFARLPILLRLYWQNLKLI